jgi:phosphate transport system permease protein
VSQAPRRRAAWLGDGLTALCGGALGLNLLLVVALLSVLTYNGAGYFWPRPVTRLELADGTIVMGEILDREHVFQSADAAATRIKVKVGNRDLGGADFRWIDESDIVARELPQQAVVLERVEWGNLYGTLVELRRGHEVLSTGPAEVWASLEQLRDRKRDDLAAARRLERKEIGAVNHDMERLRLARRKLELDAPPAGASDELKAIEGEQGRLQARFEALSQRLFDLREDLVAETLIVEAADRTRAEIPVVDVVRAVRPNDLDGAQAVAVYLSRVWEFLSGEPREANTEGGIFPAIFGTVMMVFIMSFAVAPLGVLAALYLREYARQGPVVRMVRIAVNNLAGVPSIVFGVFGLGFFVYLVGGTIDQVFYPEALPTPTYGTGGILWGSLTLALLTVPVVIVATEEGLSAVPRVVREGSLALGATKFETVWRVVVPAAAPGILTGLILAMARAAGEVAPLMIVGMVKLAPSLPIDGYFPFVHFERKFMHLGFHIYDVGFQSPNVEATKPLVFATALLLVLVVTVMNLVAIAVRNRLRAKYASSAV